MMKKEVQKLSSKKNLKLIVFSLIKDGIQPPRICQKLNLKMSAISYHLSQLKASGSIKRVGYGTWEALNFNDKEVQKINLGDSTPFIKTRKDIRGHAIHFHLKIPRIAAWKDRAEFMFRRNIQFDPLKYGQRLIVKDHKIHLFDDAIIIYSPKGMSYFSDSAEDSEKRAILNAYSIIETLETKFKISFKINKRWKLRPFNHEFAHIKDGFAKEFIEEKVKIRVLLRDGYLLIDNSFDFLENESGGKRAVEIMDGWYKPFIKSMDEYFMANQTHFDPHDVISLAKGLKVVKEKIERIEGEIYKPGSDGDSPDYFG